MKDFFKHFGHKTSPFSTVLWLLKVQLKDKNTLFLAEGKDVVHSYVEPISN